MQRQNWRYSDCLKRPLIRSGKGSAPGRARTCNPLNFKITGLTWIVERSFAWLGRNRRLSKDYEYSVQTSETLIDIAATRLILNRLASA